MLDKGLFDETNGTSEFQSELGLDDDSGLRVVSAKFLDEQKFSWDLFDGYENLRVLTYSASVNAIVRMLDKYSFANFESVFGYQGVLHDIKDILSFQKVVVGDTRAAIMGLKDNRHIRILEKVHAGHAHFYVLRKYIAHAKLTCPPNTGPGRMLELDWFRKGANLWGKRHSLRNRSSGGTGCKRR